MLFRTDKTTCEIAGKLSSEARSSHIKNKGQENISCNKSFHSATEIFKVIYMNTTFHSLSNLIATLYKKNQC